MNLIAVVFLLERLLFTWPPPADMPSFGVAPFTWAAIGMISGFAALDAFRRYPASNRLLLLLPGACGVTGALCLWLMWDYPSAYERFVKATLLKQQENEFGSFDRPGYKLAQRVLGGEYTWLENGMVR